MGQAITDLNQLLATMDPVLKEGSYAFATLSAKEKLPTHLIEASIIEEEGLSVVVREEVATAYQLDAQFKAAWITLKLHSDLAAIGLTAAFATALGQAGISCNVIAGNYHDHILVPKESKEQAMTCLKNLQAEAQRKEIIKE